MKKTKKGGKKVLGVPKVSLQNVEQLEERIQASSNFGDSVTSKFC